MTKVQKRILYHSPLIIACFLLTYVGLIESEESRTLTIAFFIGPVLVLCALFQLVVWVGLYRDNKTQNRKKLK
jgi:hypothetical protein